MGHPHGGPRRYRVPRGFILVRPDPTLEVKGGLHLAVSAQEQPPSGVVVMGGEPFDEHGAPVDRVVSVDIGDRVHYKLYAGVEMELMLDVSPLVSRCVYCNSKLGAPDELPMCPKRSDALSGDPKPHEFGLGQREPETLLVLDLKDVILVEVLEDILPDMPPMLGELYEGVPV